jgi:hypothetical protein
MVAFALAMPVGALAGTTVFHGPVTGTPFVNSCTNELMRIDLDGTSSDHSLHLPDGSIHVRIQLTAHGTAVGLTTGDVYGFSIVQRVEFRTGPDGAFVTRQVVSEIVIGHGSIPNMQMDSIVVYVYRNGELRVDLTNVTFSCH